MKNLRREVTTGESVESGNGESTENGKRIMGPKDPIYSDDVEYQTSPRSTTNSISSTRCSQRNDGPTPLGWRHSSRKMPRVLDRRTRYGSSTHPPPRTSPSTTRGGPSRAHTSIPGTRPQRRNNLVSSHGSSQRNHDLGGSCSGLGPTGPKALLRPSPKGLTKDHTGQRGSRPCPTP